MSDGQQQYMAAREAFEQSDEMRELTALNISIVQTFVNRKNERGRMLESELETTLVESSRQAWFPVPIRACAPVHSCD